MNRPDIIELVHQLTERKGEKVLDMNLLFSSVLLDICSRGRHWWRKWDVTFQFTQGTTTYDLTKSVNFTPNLTEIVVEEIVAINLILQATPLQTAELTPIFDPAGIISMKQNVTQAQPSRYMIDPNTFSSLRIDPPDATYNAEMTFWATANPSKDSAAQTVPLIPPQYHHIIVAGLEAKVNKRAYGPKDARYLDSRDSYEAAIARMMMRPYFTSNVNKQWTTDEKAVRSTTRISP